MSYKFFVTCVAHFPNDDKPLYSNESLTFMIKTATE